MSHRSRWRRALGSQGAAALLVVGVSAWRSGHDAGLAALEGAGLVAFNLALGQRLAPVFAAASGRGGAGRPRPGLLMALFLGKLAAQLGLAAAVLLGRPPAPGPFALGLATALVPLAVVAASGRPRHPVPEA